MVFLSLQMQQHTVNTLMLTGLSMPSSNDVAEDKVLNEVGVFPVETYYVTSFHCSGLNKRA